MDIQGQWTGIIKYGKGYKEYKGKALFFDLEIKQEPDHFTGTAFDTGGVGASPDSATIHGRIDGSKLDFYKEYSSYHYYAKGESKIDRSRKGPLIHYTGQYDNSDQTFSGKWIIKLGVKLWGIIPIKFTNAGTWVMRRK